MASASSQGDYINPGPIDPHVLYDQADHVSQAIWQGQERPTLQTVGSHIRLKDWVLNARQLQWLDEIGFGFFQDHSNVIKSDASLISALVERWRGETNTFHLPEGEVGISLEDVGFILALPLSGSPITAPPERRKKEVVFYEFLEMERRGKQFTDTAMDTGGLTFKYLRTEFATFLTPTSTIEDEWLQVKAFLLFCIGVVLCPASNKSSIHHKWCSLVVDRERIHGYAWGAAVLAHLYDALVRATRPDAQYFYGCTTLLQVWSYTRIPVGRPTMRQGFENAWPMSQAWSYGPTTPYDRSMEGPHHNVVVYRGELDNMRDWGLITWMPWITHYTTYAEEYDTVYDYRRFGMSQTPLICFNIVEYQLPNRFMNQFGMRREIPADPADFRPLRHLRRERFVLRDPTVPFADQIREWTEETCEFRRLIEDSRVKPSHVEYMTWYRSITRTKIHPPTMHVPPGSHEYRPRSEFNEPWAFDVMENANWIIRAHAKPNPESLPELHRRSKQWVDEYITFSRSWRGEDYGTGAGYANPYDSVDPLQFSQLSYQTPAVTAGYSQPNPEDQTVPPVPPKDKGKSKMYETSPPLRTIQYTDQEDADRGPKGAINRRLKQWKKAKLHEDWFDLPEAEARQRKWRIKGEDNDVPIFYLQSLVPGQYLWDHVIVGYIELLKERERLKRNEPLYWLADPTFMEVCMADWRDFSRWRRRRGNNKPPFRFNSNVVAMLRGIRQSSISECTFAVIIWNYGTAKEQGCIGHFTTMIIGLNTWKVLILDSLHSDTDVMKVQEMYASELDMLFEYLPAVMSSLGYRAPRVEKRDRDILTVKKRPLQENGFDCGVFALKYMDWATRGLWEDWPDRWTEEDVTEFRYRIAWELHEQQPRIP